MIYSIMPPPTVAKTPLNNGFWDIKLNSEAKIDNKNRNLEI